MNRLSMQEVQHLLVTEPAWLTALAGAVWVTRRGDPNDYVLQPGERLALPRGDSLARGDLVEAFGPARRMASPFAYWLINLAEHRGERSVRPEVSAFAQWLAEQAAATRQQIDSAVNAAVS